MAIRFTATEHFPLPKEKVFEGLTNLRDAGNWMKGFVRIDMLRGNGIEPNAAWRETRKMYGREATEEFEVVSVTPFTEIQLRVDGTKGTMKKGEFLFQYLLTDNNGGTDVTMNGEVNGLKGFRAFLFNLFSGSFKKACVNDLVSLRNYLAK